MGFSSSKLSPSVNKNLQSDWQGFTLFQSAGEFDCKRRIDLFKPCEERDPELKVVHWRGMKKKDVSDNGDSCTKWKFT